MKLKQGPWIKPGSKIDRFLESRYGSAQFTYGQIFKMLGPLIIDQFFIFFISTLTASLISASSEASMAAVALVNPITMMVMSLFFAVSNGGTVIVAQYKGKGDEKQVRRAAGQVVLMTFLVATASCILLIVFAEPIINGVFPDAEAVVREKARDYMVGFSLSLPTFSIFNGVFNVLRGVGDTKVCLRLTVIINVVHLLVSILFINVLKLDIMGTALSYNVARIIGCIIAAIIIFSPKSSLTLRMKDILRFDVRLQGAIIKMGIPFAIEQIFFNGGQMLCQVYMVPLGQSVIAANSIAGSIANLFYGVGFGVSTLAITVVGQCIGAGEIETAKRYGKRLIGLGTWVMIAGMIVLLPFTPLVLHLFRPEEATLPLIIQAFAVGLIPVPFVWSLSYVTPSILRAAGDANFTSIVSLITMWICRVGLGYVFAITLGIGLNGIWISMGIEWAVRGLIFYLRFRGTKWLEKKVV